MVHVDEYLVNDEGEVLDTMEWGVDRDPAAVWDAIRSESLTPAAGSTWSAAGSWVDGTRTVVVLTVEDAWLDTVLRAWAERLTDGAPEDLWRGSVEGEARDAEWDWAPARQAAP